MPFMSPLNYCSSEVSAISIFPLLLATSFNDLGSEVESMKFLRSEWRLRGLILTCFSAKPLVILCLYILSIKLFNLINKIRKFDF